MIVIQKNWRNRLKGKNEFKDLVWYIRKRESDMSGIFVPSGTIIDGSMYKEIKARIDQGYL